MECIEVLVRLPPVCCKWVAEQADEAGETAEEWLLYVARDALPEAGQRACRVEASHHGLADYEAEFGPITVDERQEVRDLWNGASEAIPDPAVP